MITYCQNSDTVCKFQVPLEKTPQVLMHTLHSDEMKSLKFRYEMARITGRRISQFMFQWANVCFMQHFEQRAIKWQ